MFASNDSFVREEINKASRIALAVEAYFQQHPTIHKIEVEKLMALLITKGIFLSDRKRGQPLRIFLRELYKAKQLDLIRFAMIEGTVVNRKWFFCRAK